MVPLHHLFHATSYYACSCSIWRRCMFIPFDQWNLLSCKKALLWLFVVEYAVAAIVFVGWLPQAAGYHNQASEVSGLPTVMSCLNQKISTRFLMASQIIQSISATLALSRPQYTIRLEKHPHLPKSTSSCQLIFSIIATLLIDIIV